MVRIGTATGLLVAGALLTAACSGSDSTEPEPSVITTTTEVAQVRVDDGLLRFGAIIPTTDAGVGVALEQTLQTSVASINDSGGVLGNDVELLVVDEGTTSESAAQAVNDLVEAGVDAIIGLIFTGFFGLGLFMASLSPTAVRIETIVFGNILAITPFDAAQLVVIALVTVVCLLIWWKDLMVVFFDETHARSIGLRVDALKVLFFTLLSASTVAALQTVGACLVIAMVVTPGATAYLLTDRFSRLILISVALGVGTSATGAYASYFLDGATGALIVILQTILFGLAFVFAPVHGRLATRRRASSRLTEHALTRAQVARIGARR